MTASYPGHDNPQLTLLEPHWPGTHDVCDVCDVCGHPIDAGSERWELTTGRATRTERHAVAHSAYTADSDSDDDACYDQGWARLIAGVDAADPNGHLAASWVAKEELRRVYAARGPKAARTALTRFYLHCADRSHVPEILTLATTVSAWENQILAYHDTHGASNGPTEAVNLLIEKVRRIGHGFRSFGNYRLRLLLACGVRWEAPRVARIRGRQPRSAA